MEITTKDNKSGREITVAAPKVFECESLAERVELMGEDLACKSIDDQNMVKFRAHIRGKLSASNEQGDQTYTDDDILGVDYSDWVPEVRTRMTAEEKALKALSSLPPEVAAAVLENYKKQG